MLQSLLGSTNRQLLQQVARFAERRQEVLAGNVANVDTPGYRFRDLPVAEFRQALRSAAAAAQSSPSIPFDATGTWQSPGLPQGPHVTPREFFPERLFHAETPREQPGITFQDANNRSVEHQFLEMTKNALWQQFAVQVLQGQYDQLQTVISERV